MIKLTKLNDAEYILNCEQIEMIEATPDTLITTINGKKFIARESVDEVIEKVKAYKRDIFTFGHQLLEK